MLEGILRQLFINAFTKLYGQEPPVQQVNFQKTRPEFEGDVTIVVFPFVKMAKKSPEVMADEIGREILAESEIISKYNVVKGFLNLVVSDNYWLSFFAENHQKEMFGRKEVQGSPIVVEYSSPNTNKPLHLGHIRNNLLGWSVSEILRANGENVVRVNLVNDRGIHICKSMIAWQKWGEGCTPESTGKKGDHLIGDFYVLFDKHYKEEVKQLLPANYGELSDEEKEKAKTAAEENSTLMQETREMLRKWEAGDKDIRQLWETMNQWVYDGFDVTYERLGVSFEKIYYESQTYLLGKELVNEGLENGVLYRREDGSVWCDLRNEGLDEKLLLRKDGTSVYMTQDLGTAQLRYEEYQPKKLIYVVGNEQNYHFDVLKRVLVRLGREWGNDIEHLSYGMVELPNGKMKSREGTVVDADDLMDEMVKTAKAVSEELGKAHGLSEEESNKLYDMIGIGALKYFILKVDPKKTMLFDPQESIDFNGNTASFIQYTHARISSVIRKALENGITFGNEIPVADLQPKEKMLLVNIYNWPSVLEQAAINRSPAMIANYIYDLAKDFNQFYQECSIMKEDDAKRREFRLQLADMTARLLRNASGLLGISMPNKM
ncbi:MAG: arginine--tRNA ligase [Bacteroidales bacterium]|nr:arginine--tRNA ligase [Bacteroidales bacterium]MBO5849166.1 arginine--tRNA ligase [Bacteroidales bacterium]